MSNVIDDLFLSNLKDAIKVLQRDMTVSLMSAGCFVALAATSTEEVALPVTGVPIPIPRNLAIFVTAGMYWYFATLAAVMTARIDRIASDFLRIKESAEPLDRKAALAAALTYASVPTINSFWPRFGLVLLPLALALLGLVLLFRGSLLAVGPVLGCLLFMLPNLQLAWRLRKPVGSGACEDVVD